MYREILPGRKMVGLARFELATTGLGNDRFFAKSFGVITFGLERLLLFRAGSGIELASNLQHTWYRSHIGSSDRKFSVPRLYFWRFKRTSSVLWASTGSS